MKSFKEFIVEDFQNPKDLTLDKVESLSDNGAFATLTAFRGTIDKKTNKPFYTLSDNKKRNKKLMSDIKSSGFDFTLVDGVFVEGHGTENARAVAEETFLVWTDDIKKANSLKKSMVRLGEKYDQDAILFKSGKEKNGVLIGTNDKDENGDPITFPSKGKVVNAGKFKAGVKGEFYTKLKNGQVFAFK